MQVRELCGIEALQSFRLLTGEDGLDNPMQDAVLLEYESLKQVVPDFYRGDFIVSTLYNARDDETLLLSTVEQLIDLGASGLAFKSVYYTALPEAVMELARRRGFPIFIFDDLYMEDVILSISDYVRQRQEFSRFEDPLAAILLNQGNPGEPQRHCSQMNPGRKKYMCAAYAHPGQTDSRWSLTVQNALRMRSARDLTAGYRFLQFRRGFFILCNASQGMEPGDAGEECRRLLQRMGCMEEALCVGVSNPHERADEFDCMIREAYDALLGAMLLNLETIAYSDLGCYHMIFPVMRDKSSHSSTLRLLDRLQEYDRESGSGNLYATLRVYAQQDYDIRKTAEAMGQHPNTIRYRLKKITELFGSRHGEQSAFLVGELMRLTELQELIF